MRYMELDGVRYGIPCCESCPFFNDGAGYEYTHRCQHPQWPRDSHPCMEIGEFEAGRRCDRSCPLKGNDEEAMLG